MLDWIAIQNEFDQLQAKLVDQNLGQKDRAKLQRRASQYAELLDLHKRVEAAQAVMNDCNAQLTTEQGELRELYLEELGQAMKQKEELERELEEILYPKNEQDSRDVFLEIRAGAGGQEAALFAADLFRMYSNYAVSRRWSVSIVEENFTDLGGLSKLVAHITGRDVYKFFKFESGVHRVQRVPKTETQGRVHTSTVTVAVLPEADDVDITINPSDLRIDTYRSSGAGGQHVNTTDSAIRITHLPTGLVVTCQDERSQTKNKAKALKVLQSRLLEAERERQDAAMSAERKQQVGAGERSEKIRTYNYPQNRVTDHRTEQTLKKLDVIMEGDLDDLLGPLLEWDLAQRRARGTFLEHGE